MSHFKRGYPRRSVRCSMCTDHRDGNCGKHPVDLEDGWVDGKAGGQRMRKPRVFVVESRRLGDPPSWWSRGLGTWGMWCVAGRYSTLTGAQNALRSFQQRDRSYPASYGRSEYRLRYPVQQAEAAP